MQRAHKCPIRNGGHFAEIPSWGGFDSNTEYEVGLGRSIEALHCILGSLVRVVRHDLSISAEKAHLTEEIEIVLNSLEEYSRPVYTEQLTKPGYVEWTEKMIKSINENAPKLRRKAQDAEYRLKRSDLPEAVKEIAEATYQAISSFARAALKSVAKGVPTRDTSLFNDVLVEAMVRRLERLILEHTRSVQESRGAASRLYVNGKSASSGDFVVANENEVWVLQSESFDKDTAYILRTRLGLRRDPSDVHDLNGLIGESGRDNVLVGRVEGNRLRIDESTSANLDVKGHLHVKRVSDRLGIKSAAITD